jgi:GNAT superfamily N-acetyltransferase
MPSRRLTTAVLRGSGRVIADGVLHALIVDMIVLPSHQNRGIGRAILSRLVERCRAAGIRDIQLFCARGKSGFYERCGFIARPADAPGMEYKRPEGAA